MIESGDWVSPRLNGVLYFEKPPLFYWAQAVSLKVGGVTEAATRFWPAAFALIGCILTYWIGRVLFDTRTAYFASLVLGTSLLYFAISQIVILDMAVSVLITGALYVFLAISRESNKRRKRVLSHVFFVLLALATLTKGLIGLVIPGAVIFLWVLLLNNWKSLRPLCSWSGIVVFLAVAAPWHFLAWNANSEFAWYYFVHEHFLRYLTEGHGRVQPFWFFFALLPLCLFPWTGYLYFAITDPLRGGLRQIKNRPNEVYLIIWAGFVLLFFSASGSKLIPYILPAMPPLALLIGRQISLAFTSKRETVIKAGASTFVGIAALLAVSIPWVVVTRADKVTEHAMTWAILASVILTTGAIAVYLPWPTRSPQRLVFIPCITMAAFCLVINPLGSSVRNNSTKALALTLKKLPLSSEQVYSLLDYHQDLAPYLGMEVSVAACEPEEQRYGYSIEESPANWLGKEAFLENWSNPLPQFAVVKMSDAERFAVTNPGWNAHLIQKSNRYVLVGNNSGMLLLKQEGLETLLKGEENIHLTSRL